MNWFVLVLVLVLENVQTGRVVEDEDEDDDEDEDEWPGSWRVYLVSPGNGTWPVRPR